MPGNKEQHNTHCSDEKDWLKSKKILLRCSYFLEKKKAKNLGQSNDTKSKKRGWPYKYMLTSNVDEEPLGGYAKIKQILLCFSSSGCCSDTTPRRAIANGQRSLGLIPLNQLSNTFLKILAVPNKAVFCSKRILMVIFSLSCNVSNLLLTA